MKCNYKQKHSSGKQKGVYQKVHDTLSYAELLKNTVGVVEDNMPCVPSNTKSLMVRSTIDMLLFDVNVYYFVDATKIPALNKNNEQKLFVPVTILLLSQYGVSSSKFIDDFQKNNGVIVTGN